MNFQSFGFVGFFSLTLALCLGAGRRNRPLGQAVLLIASAVFYLWSFTSAAWWGWGVLLVGSSVTYGVCRHLISGRLRGRGRRRWFLLAISYHVAVLLIFKYTGFFTGGAVAVGWAPLGLSFFTFQQLWFLKEVYTGEFPAAEMERVSGDSFTLFSFFFPTVTSGPILRPGAFFPQLKGEKFLRPDWEDARAGLYAIALGCGKKVLLADSFGVIVNNGYAHLGELAAPSAALVVLGYSLQLYFDFSGYCDMAAGIARLLGVRLPLNFDSPYRSLSVTEFWKRWHITLTTFLRECLYFPLGGSRRGAARTYLNIMIVFLVSGFWHGAGWTFLLWGAIHGACQVAERLWGSRRDRLPKAVRWALTFAVVNIAWVYFRAPTVAAGNSVLRALFSLRMERPDKWLVSGLFASELDAVRILLPSLTPWLNTILILGLYGVGLTVIAMPRSAVRRMDAFRPTWWRAAGLAAVLVWSVLSFSGITTFIYSNF